MKNILRKHFYLWSQKSFVIEVVIALALLAIGIFANYWANFYAAHSVSNYVTDILLDNLPTIDVSFLFSQGAMIFFSVVTLILLYEPKRIPFAVKSIAVFVLVRAAFMTMTHLAPPPHQAYVDPNDFIQKISFGADLFFSAHAGLPFLLALIFWQNKYLRYFFLVSTLLGGTVVILGHLHYSIDVFSALFISFGIFNISKALFPADYQFFLHSKEDI